MAPGSCRSGMASEATWPGSPSTKTGHAEACEAELSLRCLQPPPLTDHFNTLSLSLSRSVLPLLEAPADVARQRAEASVSAPEASLDLRLTVTSA